MIKLFSLIFSTFSQIRFYPFLTMMPSNHLLKTNYVFPHEWLVCTFCFSPILALFSKAMTLGEPQCTCFKLLKSCCFGFVSLAAREAYNTHIELPRNLNMKKINVFCIRLLRLSKHQQVIVLFPLTNQIETLKQRLINSQHCLCVSYGITVEFDPISLNQLSRFTR